MASTVNDRMAVGRRLASLIAVACLGVLVLSGPAAAQLGGTFDIGDGLSVQAYAMGVPVNLPNTCNYDWWYGCSPTSAGMMMGHYDRNGYGVNPATNQYPNLVPGGVAEANSYNSAVDWDGDLNPTLLCNKAIASAGHIADFYKTPPGYGGSGDDNAPPWHSFDCLADFMGTSQDACANVNGSTTFWNYPNGMRLYAKDFNNYHDWDTNGIDDRLQSGMCGLYEYVNYSGYGSGNLATDMNFFNQVTDNAAPAGFTYANFMAEINAGRPVLVHVTDPPHTGHTMYGYGYDASLARIFVYDTWNDSDGFGPFTDGKNPGYMIWGGVYSGMTLYSVTCATLTNGVPEPATISLLGFGCLLAIVRRRR